MRLTDAPGRRRRPAGKAVRPADIGHFPDVIHGPSWQGRRPKLEDHRDRVSNSAGLPNAMWRWGEDGAAEAVRLWYQPGGFVCQC